MGVVVVGVKDHTSYPLTNNKRDHDQDQSPHLEGYLVKWVRLYRGASAESSTPLLKLLAILPSQIPMYFSRSACINL